MAKLSLTLTKLFRNPTRSRHSTRPTIERRVTEPEKPIGERLEEWLKTEGYPLEYLTANVFRSHGFEVKQGWHTRAADDAKPRELDVVASLTQRVGNGFVRCQFVVECKWSADKPWILFTSPTANMARKACMMQTITDDFGRALLWLLSDGPALNLSLFESPESPAFGGRQSFSKADLFYGSISSVTSACVSETASYHSQINGLVPQHTVLSFPVIVVDGQLFDAKYDAAGRRLQVERTDWRRCHWVGSSDWNLHATVDIVSRDALPAYVADRYAATSSLLNSLAPTYELVESARVQQDPTRLQNMIGNRSGVPSLITMMLRAFEPKPSLSELGKNLG